MKVLLLGGGGREHALGWKLKQNSRVAELISAPGNPGLAGLGEILPKVDPSDGPAIARLAQKRAIDLVVVGPEAPLAAGVVDALALKRVPVWGPTRAAAALESSKAYAKEVMDRAGVRTAAWSQFDNARLALAYLRQIEPPYVVKADGLAAGKGVLVTTDFGDAETWAKRCLDGEFGVRRIVIEKFLEGDELSVFALCSGEQAIALEPARDFKRLRDGDKGPNTGGMGSYSQVVDLPPGIVHHTLEHVIKPVLRTMAEDGHPYTGFLYAGLVLTAGDPTVLEFNCRLGDPETQVVLPRLADDLLDLIEAGLSQRLDGLHLAWSSQAGLNVVMAAPGYPKAPETGARIRLGELPEGAMVFHAAIDRDAHGLVASGGRVLNVVGTGPDLPTARARAYEAVSAIDFPGAQYRRDI
ncbi:phosphoribosylamine--glycine ligase [soil metagenome]